MPHKSQMTPMMQQYQAIKDQYPDAFLFYRVGDFFELYNDDAINGARILELKLTYRSKTTANPIPMCGVPHHAVQAPIETLVDQGYKVALCEQVEDPRKAVGMVKREVTQLITPGTILDVKPGRATENNYLSAVLPTGKDYGFAYTDLSTGELKVSRLRNQFAVQNELAALNTKEIVVPTDLADDDTQWLGHDRLLSPQAVTTPSAEASYVSQDLEDPKEVQVVVMLMQYLLTTQKRSLAHIQKAVSYQPSQYLDMDMDARVNLDILKNSRTGRKADTLLAVVDQTKTAMGGRLLKQWLDRPLLDIKAINARQEQVQDLLDHYFERSELQQSLTQVYDLERLAGRVAYGNVNGRDLIQLQTSLDQIPSIQAILSQLDDGAFAEMRAQLDPVTDVADLIRHSIDPDPKLSITDGGVILAGYNQQLDTYRDTNLNGKKWMAELEARERELTGIRTLKVNNTSAAGWFISVPNGSLDKVPEDRYERKMTLTNAERFTTPELKEKAALMLTAQESAAGLEYDLFQEIRELVKAQIARLQKLAALIASLDVLQGFATVSENNHYVRPQMAASGHEVAVHGGRHPVVEQVLGTQQYIPNDVIMDHETDMLLITGPNMSGKSTYMRQFALLVIMAQAGCFVPADSAELPVFDQIFTRIGAADNLAQGQSTFMVEMMEADAALQHATASSLILFDEIGRGTATYDGMALAQAIIEYLHDHVHAKTLFSTHYHELTSLSDSLSKLQNVHVGAVEEKGTLVFLHKMLPGPADKSYGIHVAKLAGLPDSLLKRADTILQKLEANSATPAEAAVQPEPVAQVAEPEAQLSLFEPELIKPKASRVEKQLRDFDLMAATPMDAMNLLYDLQKQLKKK